MVVNWLEVEGEINKEVENAQITDLELLEFLQLKALNKT